MTGPRAFDDQERRRRAKNARLLATFLVCSTTGVVRAEVGYPIARGEPALVAMDLPRAGTFELDARGYGVVEPARPASALFFPEDAAASGFVRARVVGAGDRDLCVVLSARPLDRPVRAEGAGVCVRGDEVVLAPVRGGLAREPIASARVDGLSRRADLEIAIATAGAHTIALVYDGGSKDHVATVVATWPSPITPAVALVAGPRHAQTVRTALTTSHPPPEPREQHPSEWTVELARDTALPRSIARFYRRVARGPRSTTYVTRAIGASLLEEHAVPTLRVHPGVGHRFRDATFDARVARSLDARGRPVFVEGLKDPILVERALRALERAHKKNARVVEIGRSREGRAILALIATRDLDEHARPALLLVGGHHADEVSTPEPPLDAAKRVLEGARDTRGRAVLDTFTLVVVPLVNPDGSHVHWHERDDLGRTNLAKDDEAARDGLSVYGVDLNRNYPTGFGSVDDRFNSSDPRSRFFRGAAPASEPEVRAVLALADTFRFVAALSYHAAATRILVPYTIPGIDDPTPSAAWAIARTLVDTVPDAAPGRRYQAVRNLYPVSGTDQDALYARHGTIALLVELPARAPTRALSLDALIEGSRPLWMFLVERWLAGPSLDVTVRGGGEDVAVSVDEIVWKNGERHTVHPLTRHARAYLPATGAFTVRARAPDGREAFTVVDAREGVTSVALSLETAASDVTSAAE